MQRKLRISDILALIVALTGSLDARSQDADNGSELGEMPSSISWADGESLGLVLLDRTKIEVGETATIIIALSPAVVFCGDHAGDFPIGCFDLPSETVSGGDDQEHVKQYRITARHSGEYAILVRVTVEDRTGTAPVRRLLTGQPEAFGAGQ